MWCWSSKSLLSATVFVNSSGPLVTYHLFVNGTDEGITLFQIGPPGTNHTVKQSADYQFQAYPNNASMPIQAGKTYFVELVATFGDGETSTATALTTATSTLANPTSTNQAHHENCLLYRIERLLPYHELHHQKFLDAISRRRTRAVRGVLIMLCVRNTMVPWSGGSLGIIESQGLRSEGIQSMI